MKTYSLGRYYPGMEQEWNNFVYSSNNGTFLFDRHYMDYHKDRFTDFSSVIYDSDNKLVCIIPANTIEEGIYSHQGLTYGGLIYKNNLRTTELMKILEIVLDKFRLWNVKKFIYKPIPFIYHKEPNESDLYALYRFDAKLINRDISTVINLKSKCFIDYSERKRRNILKAKRHYFDINNINITPELWLMLENNLRNRHNTKPVHSFKEINYLYNNFPNNIIVSSISRGIDIYGAIIIYYTENVAHVQYVISNEESRDKHAIDFLLDHLISKYKFFSKVSDCKYFDFGISNERNPNILNDGLITFKEEFGGTSVCYDTYQIDL